MGSRKAPTPAPAPATRASIDGIGLGDLATDIVTGFTGTVMGWVTYLTGCDQLLLSPLASESNEFREAQWFDYTRLRFLRDPSDDVAALGPTDRATPDSGAEPSQPERATRRAGADRRAPVK